MGFSFKDCNLREWKESQQDLHANDPVEQHTAAILTLFKRTPRSPSLSPPTLLRQLPCMTRATLWWATVPAAATAGPPAREWPSKASPWSTKKHPVCSTAPPTTTPIQGLTNNTFQLWLLFVEKNHRFQWSLIWEITFSSSPLSNSLVSFLILWRTFWADTAPFKGPQLHLVHRFRNFWNTRTPGVSLQAQRSQDTLS